MNLKTILVVVFISIFSFQMHSQKCRYDFDKKDPMTEERVRRKRFTLKSFLVLNLYRRGNDFRVEAEVALAGEQNYSVEKGEEILLKLADGELLSLKAADTANPVSYVQGYQVATNYAISYNITEDEMIKISKQGIAVVRLNLAEQEITVESSKREIRKTKEGAICILMD